LASRILRTPTGLLASVVLAALVLLAILGPLIWGDAAARVDLDHILEGPSADHPFGTDNLGHDILARVLVAARFSLLLALFSVVIASVIGVPLGALPVVLGQRAGRVVNAIIDFSVALPGLLLAIFLAVVFGVGANSAVIAIGIAGAPTVARLTQTLAASVAGMDYVAAASLIGVSRARVLLRHVLPNIAEPLILNLTLAVGQALLVLSGLSFLGLGVQPPDYDWGRLLDDGVSRIYVTPVAALAPGIAIVIAGMAFNGLGEALAHAVSGRPARFRRDPTPGRSEPGRDGVLEVSGLNVTFPTPRGSVVAVRDVSFTVARGEIVGVVGESGSGKSLTALAVAQLVRPPGEVRAGRLSFLGNDLLEPPDARLRKLLGTSLSLVCQDPGTSLNPALTVGRQLAEVAEVHGGQPRPGALRLAVDRLRAVGIGDPERRARQYPHQFSGGMRQRAMIGMGLMGTPALIVADEPTSALDVTVQQQILRLLREVNGSTGASAIVITHDIALVPSICHRVLVMYAGRIVEDVAVGRLVAGPAHPYTRALLASVPDMTTDRSRPLATIPGRPPEPHEIGAGCPFAARCPSATSLCRAELPELSFVDGSGHRVACWHPQLVGSSS
jgi:peptide/nickel transport system permease protein